MKISVIIPVYNVEKYLNCCLDSVIKQNYQNIEIIIVDDGSVDESGKIIQEYAQKDNRIKVITQRNLGLSIARNNGLNIATGEYILFLDSDDYLEKTALSILVSQVKKSRVDILVFGRIEENGKKSVRVPAGLQTKSYQKGKDYFYESINGGYFRTNVWDKLYKRAFIEEYKLKFEEGLLYEDMLFTLKAFLCAGNVRTLSVYLYHYRCLRKGSITNLIRKKDLDVLVNIRLAENFLDVTERKNVRFSKAYNILIYNWVSSCIFNKYARLSLYNQEAKEIFQTVANDTVFLPYVQFCKKEKVGIRQKVFAALLLFSPFLFKVVLMFALRLKKLIRF